MTQYILTRLWQGVITLFVLATLVFLLARLTGTPVDMLLPQEYTLADREAMIQRLGLDRPLHEQYAQYMGNLLTGNVGDSMRFRRPVSELFFERFPNTLKLALFSLVIALVFGFLLGVASGTRRGSFIDAFARAISVIGMSAPSFWVGLMLMLVFAVRLDLLPVAQMRGPESYVLPGVTWSLFLLAGTASLVRSNMIEVLDSEYVKLARIKGVSENMVVWRHCLRNILIPVITFAGVQLAHLLNGSVVIESVFAWPGVGRLIYEGITARDYPLVQGCLLIVGSMIVIISLAVDLLYAYIDPRIRFGGGKG
jgi:ABC-type dipeptide/oligopeptide/nickel transport system permease component